MKKITILTILIAATFNIAAQDAYYYSGSEKIPLTKVPGKEVAIYKTIDKKGQIDFQQMNLNEKSKVTNSVGEFLAISETFIDYTGLELTPTGYFDIKLKQLGDYSVLLEIANDYNLEVVEQDRYMPLWYLLRLKLRVDGTVLDIANQIYETGLFASCSPSFSFDCEEISYDPEVSQQWGLFNDSIPDADICISEAWSFATGKGVKVAIVDSGVDVNHQDLKDNILMSYDFYTNTSPTAYYSNHGTHCAGIVAAKRNNGKNISGVAPDAQIMAAGINSESNTSPSIFASAINWAWKNGADIISCSWACPVSSKVTEAIDSAMIRGRNGLGCILVKSAGNDAGSITFPGYCRPDIIAVGMLKKNGNIHSWSCYGPNLLVCAPGYKILSTIPNNQTDIKGGTSMACPHVSGVVALMLERNPNLTINQVRQILAETAVKIGHMSYSTQGEFGLRNNSYGYGLVNAYQAVINTPKE